MQLIIGAYDLGTPSRSANIDATVTLSVVRNLQTPYFLQSNYVTTIQENQATGTSILQVSARDDDTTVSFLTSSQRIKSIDNSEEGKYLWFDFNSAFIAIWHKILISIFSLFAHTRICS